MEEKLTPMMQQWHACKSKAKDALLLFRLGDFYEAFYEDAVTLSREAEVTLTKRAEVPMSGIPAHTAESYIERLLHKGLLIAIAEQVEDPKQTKGIVKREIVRLISPGAVYSPTLLSEKNHNYFGAISIINSRYGLALIDLTTGDFKVTEIESFNSLQDELFKSSPTELIVSEKFIKLHQELIELLQKEEKIRITIKSDWYFDHKICNDFLTQHFKMHSLDGFGLKGLTCAINACGSLLAHIEETLSLSIRHITSISTYHLGSFMSIDQVTQKHLELFSSAGKNETLSLLKVLDQTTTPMGARLLKEWVAHPLLNKEEINLRLEAIEEFFESSESYKICSFLSSIKDIERLILRISTGYSTPRDLIALKHSLSPLTNLKAVLNNFCSTLLSTANSQIENMDHVADRIEKTLSSDPPIKLSEGGLIRACVSQELDELRQLKAHSEDFLLSYQEKLKEETGIKTLKVGYSKAFGYFIDISRGQASKVPPYFQKRQTLVNNERFMTEELLEFENKILSAEEKILSLEAKLYQELRLYVAFFESPIRMISKAVATIDSLFSLFTLAKKRNYTKPVPEEGVHLNIVDGRHPVLDFIDLSHNFIPNDTFINGFDQRLFLITGPNMAGKSTYIRQVALLCIMAQIGSFVPAKSMRFGLVDKIFSRIGASDDLARGQSTFMVEMTETANILRNATDRSLVILDEIGRGTSTYDGISIAWAVAEYLLTTKERAAKTLFATHYCELTEIEEKFEGAVNYHIAVKETEHGIVFLRKILKGSSDKSYGIHVAKLAGLPSEVIIKAQEILKGLESKGTKAAVKKPFVKKEQDQLLLFQSPSKEEPYEKVIQELKKIDIMSTTPIQALCLLEKMVGLLS